MTWSFVEADALKLPFADKSFDLVFGSPPYCDARTYGDKKHQRGCQEWVEWMLLATTEAVRVSRGLVIWVVAGVTRDWCYWPAPEGLLYEWQKQGGRCWRPAYWSRVGIPGSGGRQWLRSDVEHCLAFTGCQKAIPWADNTANGHPCKWQPGGAMSYRNEDGRRRNARTGVRLNRTKQEKMEMGAKAHTKANANGMVDQVYLPPALANPGNCITSIPVGGGLIGSKLAHENEAPFPEDLAKWFIRGWCPPNGTVLDPFSGSGTTVSSAVQLGRNGVGCDIRTSQVELGNRRMNELISKGVACHA